MIHKYKQQLVFRTRTGLLALALLVGIGATTAQAQFPEGYFYMTTMFVEGKGMVLEGSDGIQSNPFKGAAFMVQKYDASGLLWKAVPAGNGYFYLTTAFMENQGKVLEGSDGTEGAVMVKKYDASGLLWKAIPAGNGYFHLTTQFVEPKGMVLEGSDGTGPAIMVEKYDASGLFWKFTPAN